MLRLRPEHHVKLMAMFISKRSLSRRTFLRGMGVTVALPLLDAMVPASTALAATAANPRSRFGAVYIPNGAEGTVTVAHQDSADAYSVIATVPTFAGAKTIIMLMSGVFSLGLIGSFFVCRACWWG